MAEIKPSTSLKPGSALSTVKPTQVSRGDPVHQPQTIARVSERPERDIAEVAIDPVAQLISDFVAAPPGAASWLSDPRLAATLQTASKELAPGGRAKDVADRYAASVIETHLAARDQLMKQTNAMLKT